MKKESENIFFVGIKEPEEARRDILESLKDIVENLQRFEKFKETRKDKIEHISKLGKIIKDINKHFSSLKSSFPEAKLRAIKATRKAEKKKLGAEKKRKPAEEKKKLVTFNDDFVEKFAPTKPARKYNKLLLLIFIPGIKAKPTNPFIPCVTFILAPDTPCTS